MIQIIPSIVIRDGKVIQLTKGDPNSQKVYKDSPVDLANRFYDHGMEVVHLVDLDGAKRGRSLNYHILEAISAHTPVKVDFTGGITTDGDLSKAFEYGAKYVTAASIAITNKKEFASWILSYGREKITLGADAREGKVEMRGWEKKTNVDLFAHIEYFYERGLKYVKTTDINKNGSMEGPSYSLYQKIIEQFPGICVLASGGTTQLDQIKILSEMGVFAVIVGKALYEGQIRLDDIAHFLGTVNQ
ncbi:MAG: 1-(5-phosphoribosyl)-5-[(5-phosphoribosylamino)methylideneamino] imidazole-4-carboxamide isomerase [Cyclobacteriaceae bacterium]|nr:1-(5-phosphoribosyl)-5-[(5-phosphoribosylamino)methylideneamino] imidazole-4-carboxamide isomerase [Cyclobacteriaceae bacterium]